MAVVAGSPQGFAERAMWNGCRLRQDDRAGHYESWFQRANHGSRPLAFWIRYTVFSPKGRPEAAVGELWAVVFDGDRERVTAVKEVVPLSRCRFAASGIGVTIGAAELGDDHLVGDVASEGHRIGWTLRYESPEPPLLLLPRDLYRRRLPRAKALVGSPNAVFRGRLDVDGEGLVVDDWHGSQNHNWGSRHTDSYAWGQVAGFDGAPDVFLECSTARLRLGPWWTPPLSLVVLRVDGREIALNSPRQSLRAKGSFDFFDWRIDSAADGVRTEVHVHAPKSAFVGLRYDNPPGGAKTCLNTKLASCGLTLHENGHAPRTWTTRDRAAFEILTDRDDHGVPVVA